MKWDKPGWKNAEPIEMMYYKYYSKKNLPTNEYIIPNHKDKEFKELKSSIYVTNESKQNITPSKKDPLQWDFRLVHIRL